MFHGHLWLANGAIGIEAFVHDGRQYTYFGLFPSLIRMPILAFTSSLDGTADRAVHAGRLAAHRAVRLRCSCGGSACSSGARWPWAGPRPPRFGVLVATVMVGSVFTVLASTALRVRRGPGLEHLPDRREPLRPAGGARTTVVGPGGVRRGAHPVRQPRPAHHRMGLCRRRRAHRRLVRPRPGRPGEPAVVRAGPGRRTGAVGGRLLRQLPQVRRALRAPDHRPGLHQCQRLPPQVPGRQPQLGGGHRLHTERRPGLPPARTACASPRCSRSSPCPPAPATAVHGVLFDRRYRTASLPVVDAPALPAESAGGW